jgi:hypothetical protein
MSIAASEFLKWLLVFGVPTGGGGVSYPITMDKGGTGAALTPSDGSLFYSTATAGALLPTANNGVLVTSPAGIPSISTSLPSGLTVPGYLPLSGGTMTGTLSLAGSPVADTDAADKFYVDSITAGLPPTGAVLAATAAGVNFASVYNNGVSGVGATLTATATGTVTFDGILTVLDGVYLIKDQTAPAQNGLYKCTTAGAIGVNAVFTRDIRYNTPQDINNTGITPVINGSTQAGQGWYEVNDVLVIGTDPIQFIRFGNSGTVTSVTAGTGLTGGNITGSGTIALDIPVTPAHGGTGLTTVAINSLLYASSANTWAALASANNSVLSTNGSGVPSLSTTLPSGLTIPGYAHSGANSDITSLTGITGVIQAPTFINDSSGAPLLGFSAPASAVNYLTMRSSIATQPVLLDATGSDTTVMLNFRSKGNLYGFSPNNAVGDAALRFFLANGNDYVGLKAPSSVAAPVTFTLMNADGASGSWITTNGSGALSFTNALPTASVATTSDMVTATSTALAVTPGRQKFHPAHPKAVCYWTSVTTSTINYSFGVSSLSDNGTGSTTSNYSTSFTNTNNNVNFNLNDGANRTFSIMISNAAASVRVNSTDFNGTATDMAYNFLSVEGAM